jgi:hypothetical protein
VFFAAILVISLNRRRKKSQMKLGTPPESSSTAKEPSPDSANELNTSILSQPLPAAGPAPTASSAAQPTQDIEPDTSASAVEPEPGIDIPDRKSNFEVPPMDDPQQLNKEQIDLAARLDNLSTAVPAPSTEPVELLRLLRHPESGRLIVEVAGQRYTKLTDVTDKNVGQYILKLAAHLLSFTNGMIGTETGVKSVYNPKVGQTPLPPGVSLPTPQLPEATAPASPPPPPAESSADTAEAGLVPKPPPEAEAAFLAALRAQPPQPEPPQRRGLLGRASSAPKPTLPALNLTDEINKIVQGRLLASPLAATTELEITSDPDGGIRIKVNGTIYSSPDDIPDPEVKDLIKASIKQWERS